MSIAITGATGQLGRLVLDHLKNRGADPIALARSPEKGADLDVEVRAFDYDQPDASALAGVDTLLLISGSEIGQRDRQHRNVIQAAEQAGVKRIVYTSLLHADTSTLSLAGEHLATEAALDASPLQTTILRNGWYTENNTGSIGGSLQAGAVFGSAGEGRFSWAPRTDYAEAAAVVLTEDGHAGRTYELSGDEAHTLADLAAEISAQTGKDIPYKHLPESDYAGLLAQIGLTEGFAKALASFDVEARKGVLEDDGDDLRRLLGRPTTPLSESVKQALAAL